MQTGPMRENTVEHRHYDHDHQTGETAKEEERDEEKEHDAKDQEGAGRTETDADSSTAALFPHLTKEAIEIFEFSRRFRQQKQKALLQEQARVKRRKIKRRKLTKLGFALDEGNSATEESDDDQAADFEDRGTIADGSEGKADQEEDDDTQELMQQEAPARDTLFLNQRSRQREKLRLQLYVHGSGSTDGSSLVLKKGVERIDILESMLNHVYEDSLGPQAKDEGDGTSASRQKSRNRLRKRGPMNNDRRPQVVYWPGMPLRC